MFVCFVCAAYQLVIAFSECMFVFADMSLRMPCFVRACAPVFVSARVRLSVRSC